MTLAILTSLMGFAALEDPRPRPDAEGFLVHQVQSAYQPGAPKVRVLLPDSIGEGETFPVVYVLPVEAADGRDNGDGLVEVRKLGLQNRHRAIFVAPSFAQLPWYADHPTDPRVRQESHFLKGVLPLIERTYPARREPGGRLLLGFSKSGWGAFSLLLRHPKVFGKAAAWDAPLMMDRQGPYSSGQVFGTAENFEGYRLTGLVEKVGRDLGESPRLIHLGFGNFRDEHEAFERLLNNLAIPHRFIEGPTRPHRWGSGWLPEAVEGLLPVAPGQAR